MKLQTQVVYEQLGAADGLPAVKDEAPAEPMRRGGQPTTAKPSAAPAAAAIPSTSLRMATMRTARGGTPARAVDLQPKADAAAEDPASPAVDEEPGEAAGSTSNDDEHEPEPADGDREEDGHEEAYEGQQGIAGWQEDHQEDHLGMAYEPAPAQAATAAMETAQPRRETTQPPEPDNAVKAAIRHHQGTCGGHKQCEWCRVARAAQRTMAGLPQPRNVDYLHTTDAADRRATQEEGPGQVYMSVTCHGPPSPPAQVWKSPARLPTDDPSPLTGSSPDGAMGELRLPGAEIWRPSERMQPPDQAPRAGGHKHENDSTGLGRPREERRRCTTRSPSAEEPKRHRAPDRGRRQERARSPASTASSADRHQSSRRRAMSDPDWPAAKRKREMEAVLDHDAGRPRARPSRSRRPSRRGRSRAVSPHRIEVIIKDQRGQGATVRLKEAPTTKAAPGREDPEADVEMHSPDDARTQNAGPAVSTATRSYDRRPEQRQVSRRERSASSDSGNDEELGPGRSTNPKRWEARWAWHVGGIGASLPGASSSPEARPPHHRPFAPQCLPTPLQYGGWKLRQGLGRVVGGNEFDTAKRPEAR